MYTEEERAKWRERVARWRNGEQVYDAGKIVEKSDNTSVNKEPVVQPIKREYGKVVDPNLVERKQQQQPTIKQGKDYTQRRIEEETNKRTWLSDAADIAHGAGEGALFASNFVPFAGEMFSGGRALMNNLRSYLLHPNYKTVYHGSPYPFDIKNAWNATSNDIGLHVAENKMTADIMKDGGVTYKLRIPKENTQTIDIGRNGANQLSESYYMKARPKEGYESYYDTSVGDDFRINAIHSAGGQPSINQEHTKLYLENPVNINIRKLAFPNIKMKDQVEADNILRSYNALFDAYTGLPLNFKMVKQYNQQAADLLSRNGYKVIKYHNANPFEGGGTAYMITDPSVMDVIQKVPTGSYPGFLGSFGGYGANKLIQTMKSE